MQIEELNDTNCKTYLLVVGSEAVLVDPVRERLDTYRQLLDRHALKLKLVIETHTHADHLMMSREAKAILGAPFVMHRESPSPLIDRHVDEGDVVELGDERIEVLHCPGHTPDSLVLRIRTAGQTGYVPTGDTLLIGGSGRCDFPGGDAGLQYDAVVTRLFALPNQTGFEETEVRFPLVADIAAMHALTPSEVAQRLASASPPLVLDVREPEEFVGDPGHIEGALLVPMDALAKRLPKLIGYAEREVIVVCRAGARSASAGAILLQAGFRHVLNLQGGMLAWADAKLAVMR